jgi:predicted ATP-dependent endonuclease of OLD family
MNNKQRILKSFSIKKLFGTTDVMIPFEDTTKILIGVNGLGKTQVLNILYYTLSKKFNKLIEYVFDSVTIEFGDNSKIRFTKSDIEKFMYDAHKARRVIEKIGLENFLELRQLYSPSSIEWRRSAIYRNIIAHSRIQPKLIQEALHEAEDFDDRWFEDTSISLAKQHHAIEKQLAIYEILHFPTYRRVEEDLKTLGYDERDLDLESEQIIHFGMEDVSERFLEITQDINQLSRVGFAKISSEILSQLVKGLPTIDDHFLHTVNPKSIDIILARVGKQISEEDKERIKKIVTNKEIQAKDHSLLYFLQKLIDIYNQQRILDESIKIFRDVCNKYLVNKKLIYDESNIEIYIQLDGSTEKLPLSKLSSGEKQIISIFSKVYLASDNNHFIVFFDEPELSLAIDWQQNLLPDIVKSGKCVFLLAVTHSPFIFDNDLDKYAIGLNVYFKPSKPLAA